MLEEGSSFRQQEEIQAGQKNCSLPREITERRLGVVKRSSLLHILFICKPPPSEDKGVRRDQPYCFSSGMDAPATKKDPVRMCGCPSTSLLSRRLHGTVLQIHPLKKVLIFHREVCRWCDGENPTLVCPHIIECLASLPPGPTWQ